MNIHVKKLQASYLFICIFISVNCFSDKSLFERKVSENESLFYLNSTGNTLFSATSSNFLGTEMVFQRHGPDPIKTETKLSWLKGRMAKSSNKKCQLKYIHLF